MQTINRVMRTALPLLLLASITTAAQPASAKIADVEIVLPGATSAEGIAKGNGNTFYAGDLFAGDIFKGNVKDKTAELFIDVPAGRQAVGMAFDKRHDLLFVAGGFTGQAYAYDTKTKETVATYQFAAADNALINDVAITRTGAWFTNTAAPKLYFVPIDGYGDLGEFTTLNLTGPAADIVGQFNLNGIQATSDGKKLIVGHTGKGELYTVDPVSGASALIAGISVPNNDGIVLDGHRIWVVQNFSNQVTRFKLNDDFTAGELKKTITSGLFQIPATAALFGDILAVVNAKFDTGIPPTADEYEVVLVNA